MDKRSSSAEVSGAIMGNSRVLGTIWGSNIKIFLRKNGHDVSAVIKGPVQ